MTLQPIDSPRRFGKRSLIALAVLGVLLLLILLALSMDAGEQTRFLTGGGSVLVLALPAFLAGVLSFLAMYTAHLAGVLRIHLSGQWSRASTGRHDGHRLFPRPCHHYDLARR